MPPCTRDIHDLSMDRENIRTIYLSRHGESRNNLYGRIGGDALLTERGLLYAEALGFYINNLQVPCGKVITSTLRRTQQTAQFIHAEQEMRSEVDEINAGEHDNMTYEEIANRFPVEFALRDADKLNYRYPKGESYMDVVKRLKPFLAELEAEDNVLVISHQATIRCLLTLLLGASFPELPYLKIPLHTVIKIQLNVSGISIEYHRLPVDCVDTHRPKPENCEVDRNIEEACLTVPLHL